MDLRYCTYFGDRLAFFFLAVGAGKLATISSYFLFAAVGAVVGGVGVLVEVEVETVVDLEAGALVDMVGGKKRREGLTTPLPNWEVRPSRPSTSMSRSTLLN
jgi:hypothetical protein